MYAMRTLCMAAEDGGANGAGWLFGKPNRSLPAISPCSDLTSMAGGNRFLDEKSLNAAIFTPLARAHKRSSEVRMRD